MTLKFFNTLTRTKEVFKPIKKEEVRMYTCGPTVYNFAHIGNLRSYIFADVLRRVLLYDNFKIKHVMNITDVGHLTSDADEGEDKMLKGAKREKKTVWEIAEFYTQSFFDDMKKLHIQTPEVVCKATDHIKDMIELNEKIEKNGFTYISEGNLYFDISKFKDYGKLAKLKLEDLKAGVRVDVDKGKKNPQDFVLWFTRSKFGNQDMQWDSPWGKGFPGWHIECSAMSIRHLGEQFDIHTGGIDHIPIHHTNEIAQSEAATGKTPWVNYWLHGEFLILDKEKMAKSGDNFITIKTLEDKGYNSLVYRYFCFNAHYRSHLKFTWEALDNAKNAFEHLKNKVIEIKENPESKPNSNKYLEQFSEAIDDDLDMPKTLSILWAVIKDNELGNKEKYDLLLDFDKIFGLGFEDWEKEELVVPQDIKDLVEKREQARKDKNFEESDKIRDTLKEKGFVVEDSQEGPKLKKIS